MQPAVLQTLEQLIVTRLILRISHADTKDLPVTISPHALHDEHTHTLNATVEPDFLIPSINNQVRNGLLKRPIPPILEVLIERGDKATDSALAETRATQFLRDGFHLAGTDTLDVHLHQRAHQCLLRPLVPLEQLRLKRSLTILRHQQVQRANPSPQLPWLTPIAIPTPLA